MGRRTRQDLFPDENLSRKNAPSASPGEVGVLAGEPACGPAAVPSGGVFAASESLSHVACSVLRSLSA